METLTDDERQALIDHQDHDPLPAVWVVGGTLLIRAIFSLSSCNWPKEGLPTEGPVLGAFVHLDCVRSPRSRFAF